MSGGYQGSRGDLPVPPGFADLGEDDHADLAELAAFMSAAAPAAAAPASVQDSVRRSGMGLQGEDEAQIEVLNWVGGNSDASHLVHPDHVNFETLGLSQGLIDGIDDMGWVKPSKIQAAALPVIVAKDGRPGQNMIGQAQNGSGKTGTFALALLSCIDIAVLECQAVVMCPTRELARQTEAVISALGTRLAVQTHLAVPMGGNPRSVACHVLVGTPGKTVEFCKRKLVNTQAVKVWVVDEADHMLETMAADVTQIRKFLPTQGMQILFFSATFPDQIREYALQMCPEPRTSIEIKKAELTVSCVTQMYMECPDDGSKIKQVTDLYGAMTVGQSIVFVNNRKTAFRVAQRMKDQGFSVSLICGTQQTWTAKLTPEELHQRLWDTYDFPDWQQLTSMRLEDLREELQRRGGAPPGPELEKMDAEAVRERLKKGGGISAGKLAKMDEEQLKAELSQRAAERMDPTMRDKIMDEFRNGTTRVLVSTDVLSRGIDVPQVTLVVNYELPLTWPERRVATETYLHRVGRTGRFGLKGIAVSLVTPSEMPMIQEIQQHFNCTVQPMQHDFEQLEDALRKLR